MMDLISREDRGHKTASTALPATRRSTCDECGVRLALPASRLRNGHQRCAEGEWSALD